MDAVGEAACKEQQTTQKRTAAKGKGSTADGSASEDEHGKRSEQMQNALLTTAKLLQRDKSTWQMDEARGEISGDKARRQAARRGSGPFR